MSLLTDQQLIAAVSYNAWAYEEVFKESGLPFAFTKKYHGAFSPSSPSAYAPSHPNFAEATAHFQAEYKLVVDGKLGTRTLTKIHEVFPEGPLGQDSGYLYAGQGHKQILLTETERSRIVQFTVKFEGGRAKNPYASMNEDAEWLGAFDQPKRDSNNKLIPVGKRQNYPNFSPHRASRFHPSGGFHVGLSWGAWQAAQEPGSLGDLLLRMRSVAPEVFCDVFGPAWIALLDTTTATNRRTGRFSPRTQKVEGAYLWQEPWLGRFRAAGSLEVFQSAQRVWVAQQYLDKSLPIAGEYNLDSCGALAVLFDIAVQFGIGGMKRYVGAAKLTEGAPFDPEGIKRVIQRLPKSHHKRRNAILEGAGQDVRYTW